MLQEEAFGGRAGKYVPHAVPPVTRNLKCATCSGRARPAGMATQNLAAFLQRLLTLRKANPLVVGLIDLRARSHLSDSDCQIVVRPDAAQVVKAEIRGPKAKAM